MKPDEAVARHATSTSADSDGAAVSATDASSLGDSTLNVNLGIPVIVVLTKVRVMAACRVIVA